MLTGFVGLQGANALVIWMTVVLAVVVGALACALKNFWILIPIGAIWLLALMVYSYVAGVAGQVYLCALYIYASEGVVPEPYSQDSHGHGLEGEEDLIQELLKSDLPRFGHRFSRWPPRFFSIR